MADYRLMDHTADVGIEWEARSLPGLFEKGAAAFADLLAGAEGASGTEVSRTFAVEGIDLPDLVVRFFQELLYLFETKRELLPDVHVGKIEPGSSGSKASLAARASGRKFDLARDHAATVIKAVTYHRLSVEQMPGGGWRAAVLFDI